MNTQLRNFLIAITVVVVVGAAIFFYEQQQQQKNTVPPTEPATPSNTSPDPDDNMDPPDDNVLIPPDDPTAPDGTGQDDMIAGDTVEDDIEIDNTDEIAETFRISETTYCPDPTQFSDPVTLSRNECYQQCLGSTDCSGFMYNDTGLCQLMSGCNVDPVNNSHVTYYEKISDIIERDDQGIPVDPSLITENDVARLYSVETEKICKDSQLQALTDGSQLADYQRVSPGQCLSLCRNNPPCKHFKYYFNPSENEKIGPCYIMNDCSRLSDQKATDTNQVNWYTKL